MRWMRFTFLFLLLISPTCFAQKQYSEAACLLLQHQMLQFAHQPNSHNYQSAKREVNNHCQNPIPAPDKELNLTNIPVKTITVGNTKNTAATQPANPKVVVTTNPQPVKPATSITPKPADILKQLFAPVLALFGSLLAFLVLIVLVMGLLALFFVRHGARIKGALAERALHNVLVKELPASYQHYRNLVIPTEQGDLTEIDHLVVSAYGIFVIEVKNYRGWIFGGEKQPRWTVQRFRSKHQFMNPLHQNYKHTEAIKHVLGLNGKDSEAVVHSIVAFSQRAEFKTQIPLNVMYIDLVGDYLQQFYQPCFDDEQVRQFTARLNLAQASRKALSKLHLAQVKTRNAA